MSNNSLKLKALCLALCGAAAMPLQASAQEGSADATVTRDATTGQLRAATAEEAGALDAVKKEKARMFRVAPKQMRGHNHGRGIHSARMTDDMLSASVAVINKDGKVEQECFDSKVEADAAVASGVLTHVHSHAITQPATE